MLNNEYQDAKLETLEFLANIIDDKFTANHPPRSLSGEYFKTALLHMKSDKSINHFINAIYSLITIKDVYMQNELYKIIFHILGKHHLQTIPINDDTIFNHICINSISDKSISSLADIIYTISKISDDEYLVIDTLLYSIMNNPEGFQKIHDMILAYNPVDTYSV